MKIKPGRPLELVTRVRRRFPRKKTKRDFYCLGVGATHWKVPIRTREFKEIQGMGDREGHTANFVKNAVNRAARGRVGGLGICRHVAINTVTNT